MSNSILSKILLVIGLPLIVGLLAALSSYFHFGAPLDNYIYDYSQGLIEEEPYDDLLIIEIDERSILELGRWPWPRETHAELLNILTDSNVNAVGFDVIFSDYDETKPLSDQAFTRALKASGKVVFPVHIEQLNHAGQMLEVLPTPDFFQASAAAGHVHIEYDDDGVCRSVFLKEGLGEAYWSHFSVELLKVETDLDRKLPGKINRNKNEVSALTIVRDHHNFIPFHFPANSFESVSYVDVVRGEVPPSLLAGKTVMVGATATGLSDIINTPIGIIPGVELNGYILQALRSDNFIRDLSLLLTSLISCLVTLVIVFCITGLAVQSTFTAIVFSNFIIVFSSILALLVFRVWIPPLAAVIAVSCFYPLFSWQRLRLAVSYLRRELESLLAKSQEGERVQSLDNVVIGINYLSLVLPIRHWQIFSIRGEDKICIKTQSDKDMVSRTESLKEEMLVANKLFTIGQDKFVLEVFWNDIYGKAYTFLLDQLSESAPSKEIPHTWGYGIVERTIEELNQAKEESDKNSRLVQQTLSQLTESVVVADFCGRIISVNNEAKKFLKPLEKNQHLIDLLSVIKINSGIGWPEVFKAMVDNKESFSFEARLEERGLDFICRGGFLNIEGEDPDTVIITMTNTTQLKKVERDRRDALSFLSHDLQAPMVSVLSIIEQQYLSEIDANKSELLRSIEFHVRKNLAYAEKFLQLSRAENISQTQFSLCDMHSVMDAAIYQVINTAKLKGISLVNERGQEDTWVLGNSDLLERAITNILSNAIKYSANDTTVTTKVQASNDCVYVLVADQGPGIEGNVERLFDRFHRGRDQGQKGTGLGLSFVKVVAEKHMGNVQIRSKLGQGATVIFTLPVFEENLPN